MNEEQVQSPRNDRTTILIAVILVLSFGIALFLAGYAFSTYRQNTKKASTPTYPINRVNSDLPLNLQTHGIQSAQIIYTFSGHITNIIPIIKNKAGVQIYGIQISVDGKDLPFAFEIEEDTSIITGIDEEGKTKRLKFSDLKKSDALIVDYTADLKNSKNLYVIRMVKRL